MTCLPASHCRCPGMSLQVPWKRWSRATSPIEWARLIHASQPSMQTAIGKLVTRNATLTTSSIVDVVTDGTSAARLSTATTSWWFCRTLTDTVPRRAREDLGVTSSSIVVEEVTRLLRPLMAQVLYQVFCCMSSQSNDPVLLQLDYASIPTLLRSCLTSTDGRISLQSRLLLHAQ